MVGGTESGGSGEQNSKVPSAAGYEPNCFSLK